MASISSLTGSSSTSSLYGNKNIISGLASGMDTESMIENSVSGYKTKINTLLQKQTKLSWKRDAFRSVTDKLVELSQKYTSYTSKTNLASSGFFSGSISTTAEGANASKIVATGKSTSDIQIKGVEQLATAAKYTVDAAALQGRDKTTATGGEINWGKDVKTSKVSGTLRLAFGSQDIALSFTDSEVFENQQEFVDAINKKLEDQTITFSGGSTDKASNRIKATLADDGTVKFEHTGTGAANKLYISSVSGSLKDIVGEVDSSGDKPVTSFKAPAADKLYTETDKAEYLSGQSISVTLDGVTKNIKIGDFTKETNYDKKDPTAALASNLQKSIDEAFGSGKITVNGDDKKLSFTIADGSNTLSGLKVSASSTVGEALGIGKSGISSYLNTGKTLEELGFFDSGKYELGRVKGTAPKDVDPATFTTGGLKPATDKDGNQLTMSGKPNGTKLYLDADNNLVRIGSNGKDLYRVEDNGNGGYTDIRTQTMTINGVEIGTFTKDSTLDDVINAINNNKDAGVKVSYSKISDKFTITATETGSAKNITIESNKKTVNGVDKETNLAAALFGSVDKTTTGYEEGKDAKLMVTVDGEDHYLTRSTNSFDLDGLSVTLKDKFGTFEENPTTNKMEVKDTEAVTFSTKADTSKITDALKSFVEEVNTVLKEIHDAYATQPAEKNKSKHTKYEPLTDDDKEGMSESAIKEYEEKAKQGILFGDSDLSSLYSNLTNMLTTGSNGANLRAIGIDSTLENGVISLSLDEEKLASALEADPDKVKNTFATTSSGGGLMADMKKTLDRYANTSSATPGILVKKAGTAKSPLSLLDNSMQDEMDEVDKQIDKWQTKMSDKIDYYTRQFTALETLMAQMNNQSSMISGMMGGY